MKLSKTTLILVFIFIILLNIAFRYPQDDHERGADSFGNHAEAQALNNQDYDKRFIHPLSFFGLYPYSHNMGGMFLLSGLSLLTGLSVEISILVLSTILGIFSAFAIYIFAREVYDNQIFCISSAILFSLTRGVLGFTRWTYSYRGPYICLLPIFLFLLIRIYKDKNHRAINISLALIFLVILASIHRMTYFLIYLLIVFVIAIIVYKAIKNINISLKKKTRYGVIALITMTLIFLLYIPLSPWAFYGIGGVEKGLEEGGKYFLKGSSPVIQILNLGILYAMEFGVLIILAVVGYFIMVNKSRKHFSFLFLTAILFSFTPFWGDMTYAVTYFLPYLTLFVGMGIVFLARLLEKKDYMKPFTLGIVMTILVVAVTIPAFVVVKHDIPRYEEYPDVCKVEDETYNCALFLKYSSNDVALSNIGFITGKIDAFAGTRKIEVPEHFNQSKVKFASFKDFISGETDYLWEETTPQKYPTITYSVFLYKRDAESDYIRNALDYHLQGNGTYNVIVMNFMPNTYLYEHKGEFIESEFLKTLHQKYYKIYDDGFEHVMFLKYS